jgi:RNA polymerase sigma factor FliA
VITAPAPPASVDRTRNDAKSNDAKSNDAKSNDTESLVRENLPLVGYLVNEIIVRLPGHISRDDLTGAGLAALAQSAVAFDPSRGVPFNRYANTRIRGALLDELRSHDWVGRSVRQKARQRDTAATQLEAQLGRSATRDELASFMGVEPAALSSVDGDVHRSVVLSLQGFGDIDVLESALPSGEQSPEEVLMRREQVGYLHGAVAALPERLRVVIEGYFFDGRTTAQIAADLGVGESRVSQLRSEALVLLRDGMNSQLAPDMVPPEARPVRSWPGAGRRTSRPSVPRATSARACPCSPKRSPRRLTRACAASPDGWRRHERRIRPSSRSAVPALASRRVAVWVWVWVNMTSISPVSARAGRLLIPAAPRPLNSSVVAQPGSPPTFDVPTPRQATPPTMTTRVEVSMSAGVQIVIIYDLETGHAIYQAPPEQTRRVLDKAMATPQFRGLRNPRD